MNKMRLVADVSHHLNPFLRRRRQGWTHWMILLALWRGESSAPWTTLTLGAGMCLSTSQCTSFVAATLQILKLEI